MHKFTLFSPVCPGPLNSCMPTSQMLCYLSHSQCFIIFWQICVVVGCWLAVGKTSSTRAAAASAASTSCRPTSSEISGTNSLDCRRSKGSTKMQFPLRFKNQIFSSHFDEENCYLQMY